MVSIIGYIYGFSLMQECEANALDWVRHAEPFPLVFSVLPSCEHDIHRHYTCMDNNLKRDH